MDSATEPDESLLVQVRDFLANLYDYAYLQTCPLVGRLAPPDRSDPVQKMRAVRSLVLKTIEEMNPGRRMSFRAPGARGHSALNLHYVEGLTIAEAAVELATSERTLYRELRKAEQDLSVLLLAHREVPSPREPAGPPRGELITEEAERMGSTVEDLPVRPLLAGSLAAAARLSEQRGVAIETSLPGGEAQVRTHRVLARQALISLLSHAVQAAQQGSTVTLAAQLAGGALRIEIGYLSSQPAIGVGERFPLDAQRLLQRLGAQWDVQVRASGRVTFAFTLGNGAGCRVLVIDDNERLLELFRRYLADEDYDVIGASDGREGLHIAEESLPDLIVLDVMMPQNDGWEVLQRLQVREKTRQIPVIVCSVLNDPELALSLGAAGFVPKPVEREQLLSALARLRPGTRPRSRPEGPAGF